jgi:invasion protein IalB
MLRINQRAESQPMQLAQMSFSCLLAGALLVAAGTAKAQQAAPSDVPQRTTATYANWVLACDTQPGPPPQKTCEIVQMVQAQQQGRAVPFSRIAVMHPVRGQPVKLMIEVPTNVTLSTNVRIQTVDADPGVAAPFARCAPSGCFVDFELKDDVLKKFRTASGNGKITYADVNGHDVVVPLSFSGFSQAFDALAKE